MLMTACNHLLIAFSIHQLRAVSSGKDDLQVDGEQLKRDAEMIPEG